MADPVHLRHLASLARLEVGEEEIAKLAEEATAVLRLFDQLPAGAAAPAAAAAGEGRADVPEPSDPATVAAILSQVARRDGRTILVPRGGES